MHNATHIIWHDIKRERASKLAIVGGAEHWAPARERITEKLGTGDSSRRLPVIICPTTTTIVVCSSSSIHKKNWLQFWGGSTDIRLAGWQDHSQHNNRQGGVGYGGYQRSIWLANGSFTLRQLVMGSGSKSQIRVPFAGFGSVSGTKNVGFSSGFGGFWLPDYITTDGFG